MNSEAMLVVDTAKQEQEAGVRSIGLTDRRVLYRVPGAHVELRLMQEGDGRPGTRWLYGMWIDDEAEATDLRVDQLHAQLPDTHVASGKRSNFALLVNREREVTLRLQKADRAPITITLDISTP